MELSKYFGEETLAEREKRLFREATGFITNFQDSKLPRYQAAIEEYKKIAPEVQLEIGEGWKYYKHALYCTSNTRNLSPFWRIFERLEAVYKLKED